MPVTERALHVVDVFSAQPLRGNPVAVVLDAEGLSTADMQAIAAWTNLSETTFVLPADHPDADYRLRIFTPRGELPFAGHPTLGSAHALLASGRLRARQGELVQSCAVGQVRLRVEAADVPAEADDRTAADAATSVQRLVLTLPEARLQDVSEETVATLQLVLGAALRRGCVPSVVDVGPRWLVAELPSVQALLALTPDQAACAHLEQRLSVTGITVFARAPGETLALEVRSFAASSGISEDPVCGSGNGAVAAFLQLTGTLPATGARYVARQGRCVGRDGQVHVHVTGTGRIEVGGDCITTLAGVLRLPAPL